MEKLKKIPVIGYILRVIIAVCKLPKHIDNLYQVLGEHREDNLEAIKRLQEQNDKLQMQYEEALREHQTLQVQCEELKRWNADRMEENAGLQNVVDKNVEELKRWNADRMQEIARLQNKADELESWNADRMKEIRALQNFDVDESYIKKMNLVSSIYPTLWGDSERLHISELASVGSCFFNTNSGHITIGDYTFSGSGVSILAGSHDMRLTGLPRRDCELKEGCDISIGKGVWLASNCTILGPAVIEDNAVIAAGAVVTPGTHVPSGMVYGGVPARKILDTVCRSCADRNEAYIEALKREDEVLFLDGWSEEKESIINGMGYLGHFLNDNCARITTTKGSITLYINAENATQEDIILGVHGDTPIPLGDMSGKIVIDTEKECMRSIEGRKDIVIQRKKNDAVLFVSYVH